MALRVAALAGGVGGAKLADGLYQNLPPENLTIIVNTADDFEHLGLQISPDLDTVLYTLAGVASRSRGWGRSGETWQAMETIEKLGGPTWFRLGDKDIGLHLVRTQELNAGKTLSEVTRSLSESLGVRARIVPMSDEPVRTQVISDEGTLPFQEYFVARRCEPKVKEFQFHGIEEAKPAPGVLTAIEEADLVVMCPSNPWVSLDPILALPGVRDALKQSIVLGVTPIIDGEALKGPAAKMYRELGIEPSAKAVANHYDDILTAFVIDEQDKEQLEPISRLGVIPKVLPTVMTNKQERKTLAKQVLTFAAELRIEVS
ncbi:MAG: 2-phospho-L-lactate transferase [Anaerolineales bacterium]